MNFFKRFFHKKEEKDTGKKTELKRLAILKINKIKKSRFSQKLFNQFVFFFYKFIEERLSIKKQLTYEELISKLREKRIKRHIKNKFIKLSSEINRIQYGNEEINKQKFTELIKKFEEIIKQF